MTTLGTVEPQMPGVRLPVTPILGGCLFLTGIASASIAPYRAIVAIEGLGISNGSYALIMTFSAIGAAVASPVLGYFSDHVSDRRLLVIACAMLGALAYGLVYLFPTPLVYVLAFCLIMPFGGALFSQSFAYSRAYYDRRQPKRAEFMMSALRSLFSLAWVVAPPVVGWLASTYSVFSVFAAAGIAQVACTLMYAVLFIEPTAKIGARKQASPGQKAASGIAPDRLVGIGGVALVRIALVLHLTALPLVLLNDLGGNLAQVGINAAVAAALEVPFMLAWGVAASKLSKEVILIANAALFAGYMVLVYFARSVEQVLLLQGLNAIATAALLSVTISYMQDAIRGRLGLSTSLIDVVTVISGLAAATAFATLSSAHSYVAILLAGALVSLTGAGMIGVSVLVLRRTGPTASRV